MPYNMGNFRINSLLDRPKTLVFVDGSMIDVMLKELVYTDKTFIGLFDTDGVFINWAHIVAIKNASQREEV